MWSYTIDPHGTDIGGELLPAVYITCGNCATLHSLDDKAKAIMQNATPQKKA